MSTQTDTDAVTLKMGSEPTDLPPKADAQPATEENVAEKKKKPPPRDIVAIMAIGGVASLGVVLFVAMVLSLAEVNSASNGVHATTCALSSVGYDTAMFTKPWNIAGPSWLMAFTVVVAFVIRKYFFAWLAEKLYPSLPPFKIVKCGNYMLELLGTSIALGGTSYYGFWDLLFNPGNWDPTTPDQARDLVAGLNLMILCFIATYVLEMAFDTHMRLGLMLHHWVTIILALWGNLMIFYTDGNIHVFRAFFALSLYMSTEQNVFIEMLGYHWHVNYVWMYKFSAWYYTISRAAIVVASVWTWWDARWAVFGSDAPSNNMLVFGLWLFVLPANVILNATQFTTIQSLFGIAASVEKRQNARQTNNLSRTAMLNVFERIDADLGGTIDKAEWDRYISNLSSTRSGPSRIEIGIVFPQMVRELVFTEMESDYDGTITFEEFYSYMDQYVMDIEQVVTLSPRAKSTEDETRSQSTVLGKVHKDERVGIVEFGLTLETLMTKLFLEMSGNHPETQDMLLGVHTKLMNKLDSTALHNDRYRDSYQNLNIDPSMRESIRTRLRTTDDSSNQLLVSADKDCSMPAAAAESATGMHEEINALTKPL